MNRCIQKPDSINILNYFQNSSQITGFIVLFARIKHAVDFFSQRRKVRKGITRKVKIVYYFSTLQEQHSANSTNPSFPLLLCEIFFLLYYSIEKLSAVRLEEHLPNTLWRKTSFTEWTQFLVSFVKLFSIVHYFPWK
jgi:hypothetical protein